MLNTIHIRNTKGQLLLSFGANVKKSRFSGPNPLPSCSTSEAVIDEEEEEDQVRGQSDGAEKLTGTAIMPLLF